MMAFHTLFGDFEDIIRLHATRHTILFSLDWVYLFVICPTKQKRPDVKIVLYPLMLDTKPIDLANMYSNMKTYLELLYGLFFIPIYTCR